MITMLHQRLGTAIVYVAHDQIEATTTASRIAAIRDGGTQQFVPPEEVYKRTANVCRELHRLARDEFPGRRLEPGTGGLGVPRGAAWPPLP